MQLQRREQRRQIQALLDRMPRHERDALVLRYVEGFSVREVAGVLRRSEKATESLVSRARRRAFAWGKGVLTDEMER